LLTPFLDRSGYVFILKDTVDPELDAHSFSRLALDPDPQKVHVDPKHKTLADISAVKVQYEEISNIFTHTDQSDLHIVLVV
jgi:hypothetical protein